MKLAQMQQVSVCETIFKNFTLLDTCAELQQLSVLRVNYKKIMGDVFDTYVQELLQVYQINKEAEAQMKSKTEESKEGEADKKKKKKESVTQIQFGKGTRAFFDFLCTLETEAGGDQAVFRAKLDFLKNAEL